MFQSENVIPFYITRSNKGAQMK